ncbi:TetR/AcrR family transcriptional regulator [Nocardia rhizosphaerihabitans]|uniref:TetR family transcriptional regulator n=1 Tax=Nocardia rhizosphaerihabitans TaxID=1691570 RepID=A0ABQ2KM93_9NOCA|nr:TetR/AcrR family transcriptional regulator [Nocardia rhizosphaerihabitans]GGN86593.1 TetR family transcriptional regulator [Nocardia rhizosphaerihabitans]
MARTKEFDPDVVLDRALDLFWQRGYETTSIADLIDHLGIARGCIYATFGSKHELFMKALQRHLEIVDARVTAELARPGPALPAIRGLIDRFVNESCAENRFLGCLVTTAAVELAARDADVARLVESSWARTETALFSALSRARAQEELPPDADTRAMARFLLVFFQGVWVLERAPNSATRLRDAGRVAASILG